MSKQTNYPEIIFVFSEAYKNTGSTIMRGKQLSSMVSAVRPDLKVRYEAADKNFKDSILILTKGAIQTLSNHNLREYKERNNLLVFDPVDWTVEDEKLVYADTIIAASEAALNYYRSDSKYIRPVLVDHHPDPRLKNIRINQHRPFRVGYFGELVNAVITPKIEKEVFFESVSTRNSASDWISKLTDYPMHYAVRSNQKTEGFKPFLKGFMAAKSSSCVVVQEGQDDAVRWLGADYPFLIKGTVNERNIVKTINYAKKSYNTAVWDQAMKVMSDIEQAVSDDAIVAQFMNALDSIFRAEKT